MPKENKDIFETTDPLGNVIYLTNERFYHITLGHPELHGEEKSIKLTVEDPDNVYRDKEYDTTFCYYRQHDNVILRSYGTNIKVVVDRNLQGQIKTAYVTNSNKERTENFYKKPKTSTKKDFEA
jgi:hypothetical protein